MEIQTLISTCNNGCSIQWSVFFPRIFLTYAICNSELSVGGQFYFKVDFIAGETFYQQVTNLKIIFLVIFSV